LEGDEMTIRKHLLSDDVRGSRVHAYYQEGRRRWGFPDYRQLDGHCCGFLAALTVVHYFDPDVPTRDVLRVVQPGAHGGCDGERLKRSLARFGIGAAYRERLGPSRIQSLIERGTPVIVTVWPWDWLTDHWTVIGKVDLEEERVFLTNYGPYHHGMRWADFAEIWWPHGGGLVCSAEV
jgi:hypothetical protein